MPILQQKTKIGKAGGTGNTLRSSIPSSMVQALDLKEGDYIEWTLEELGNPPQLIIKKYVEDKK
jgi:antitoxin component of MazEF toxin-antitoxin module